MLSFVIFVDYEPVTLALELKDGNLTGNVDTQEMYRTFNCGVGMVLCVSPGNSAAVISQLNSAGHTAWEVGTIASGKGEVEFR